MARAALAKKLHISRQQIQRVVRKMSDAGEVEPAESDVEGWAAKVDEHLRRPHVLDKLTAAQRDELLRRVAAGASVRDVQGWVTRLGHRVSHGTIHNFIRQNGR